MENASNDRIGGDAMSGRHRHIDGSEVVGEVPGEAGLEDADSADLAFACSDSDDSARLFTATVVAHDGFETVCAFHASLATEEAEVAGRLYCRMGATMADARIIEGFDRADPVVVALVSQAMCDMLDAVAADPDSPLATGIDINIEQRTLA